MSLAIFLPLYEEGARFMLARNVLIHEIDVQKHIIRRHPLRTSFRSCYRWTDHTMCSSSRSQPAVIGCCGGPARYVSNPGNVPYRSCRLCTRQHELDDTDQRCVCPERSRSRSRDRSVICPMGVTLFSNIAMCIILSSPFCPLQVAVIVQ